jgi:hypothetical protein
MPSITELGKLIDELAASIPDSGMTGDEQEEYSTMLLRLQNTVHTGEPSERIVKECLAFFAWVKSRAA